MQQTLDQKWPRIRSAGVNSCRILRFFQTRNGSQKLVENGTQICRRFLFWAAAGVYVVFIYVIA